MYALSFSPVFDPTKILLSLLNSSLILFYSYACERLVSEFRANVFACTRVVWQQDWGAKDVRVFFILKKRRYVFTQV